VELNLRTVLWSRADAFGAEFAEITIVRDRLKAAGVAMGSEPAPYRLDYALEIGPRFETRSIRVQATGDDWRRNLDLRRSDEGWSVECKQDGQPPFPEWTADILSLADAIDCDLGLSPLTNTLPILREGVLDGAGPIEITAAWISVPDLSVQAERQRYTFLGTEPGVTIVRFESLDGSFTADIRFDGDGLVIDYPGIASRVA
jgi:hypothetical protein